MAIAGKDTVIVIDDVNLSGFFDSLDEEDSIAALIATGFGKSAVVRVPGLKDGKLSLTGFFDSAVDGVDEELRTLFTSARVITVGLEGLVIGKPTTLVYPLTTSYRRMAKVDDVLKISAEAEASDGGLAFGHSHHALTAETGTMNGASVDNAASSANGGVAHLHVTAATLTSATVKIQHSVDDAVWADLITFAAVTARTKERKAVTGTVNRYTRAIVSAFTGTSFTFTAAFARL